MARPLIQTEERCPQCDYSLKGLPNHHHCPECGFEYESKEFQVFKQPKPHLVLRTIGVVVGLSCPAYLSVITSSWLVRALMAIVVAGALFSVFRRRHRRWMGRRVALWRGGVVILPDDGDLQRISWGQIGTIGRNFVNGGVLIRTPENVKLATFGAEFLGSPRRAVKFIAAAEEWLTRYRAEHPEEDA